MKILLITPGLTSPSGRFRVTQFAEPLRAQGSEVVIREIFPNRLWIPGNNFSDAFFSRSRIAAVVRILSFFWVFRDVESFDIVFMNRDLAPETRLGFLEMCLAKRNPRLIFDFDDAIHLGSRKQKLELILPHFQCVIAGNEYLANFARENHERVLIWPTVVDTEKYKPVGKRKDGPYRVGWSGSKTNLKKHVPMLEKIMVALAEEMELEFVVVCDEKPNFLWRGVKIIYLPWKEESEVQSIQAMDVGVFPLLDGDFEKGKCGCKALLYMACGVPALVSPVGVNRDIVIHGETGFHCQNQDDWMRSLRILAGNDAMRQKLGLAGRERVAQHYSVKSLLPKMIKTFKEVASGS